METINLTIKEKRKGFVGEESPSSQMEEKHIQLNNYARIHIPNVFEHQYAEYISGLKPPYSNIDSYLKKAKKNNNVEMDQKFNGD